MRDNEKDHFQFGGLYEKVLLLAPSWDKEDLIWGFSQHYLEIENPH
jgi:hypothetical protein